MVSLQSPAQRATISMSVVTICNPSERFDFSPFLKGQHPLQHTVHTTLNGFPEEPLSNGGFVMPSPSHTAASSWSGINFSSFSASGERHSNNISVLHGAVSRNMFSSMGLSPCEMGSLQPNFPHSRGNMTSRGTGNLVARQFMNNIVMSGNVVEGHAPGTSQSSYMTRRQRGSPRMEEEPASKLTGIECGICRKRTADLMTRCVPQKHFYCGGCILPFVNQHKCCPSCGSFCDDLDNIFE